MAKPKISNLQWNLLTELHRGGCQIDPEYLRQPTDGALYVEQIPTIGPELEKRGEACSLTVRLVLVARRSTMIAKVSIEADWLHGKFRSFERCAQHPGYYCLSSGSMDGEQNPHCVEGRLLNTPERINRKLPAGTIQKGLLLGSFDSALPSLPILHATAKIEDVLGEIFCFPLVLRTTLATSENAFLGLGFKTPAPKNGTR